MSGGHGTTLCLEKQSWNTSPGCPDILLFPSDTDEMRSSALCVTTVVTSHSLVTPLPTPAQGQFQFQQEQQREPATSQPSQTPQNKPSAAASEPPLPPARPTAPAQPSALAAKPHPLHSFSFFPPFSFKCQLSCPLHLQGRTGNPPAHPGWGTQDPLGSAPGHPGRSCQLLLSLKQWDQASAAAPMAIQIFIPGPRQKPGVPGLILTTPPASSPL